MKKAIISAMFVFMAFSAAFSQSTECRIASKQLDNYAAQVNSSYQIEYWRGIPQRCPASFWNGFGWVSYNPQMVQNCRNQQFWNLNNWYWAQCRQMNIWYSQIVNACLVESNDEPLIKIHHKKKDNDDDDVDHEPQRKVDVTKTKKLIVDTKQSTAKVDDIEIPDTPDAYKPNN